MAESASILARPTRYPNLYAWFVFLSAMDIMLTWIILYVGGWEANVLADWVIRRYELPGMVIYKFAIVVFVVVLCEIIGRRHDRAGRRLAEWAVALNSIPVLIALYQLALHL